jgi:hypothetical protein
LVSRYTLNPHILLASTSSKFARSGSARDSARTKSESITKSAAGLDTTSWEPSSLRNKSGGLTKNATPGQIVAELPDLEEEDVREALAYAAALAQDEVHPIRA